MRISLGGMIWGGFLSTEERKELVWLARDGSAEHRVGRRANAILLLDDGLSCERVAEVLYLDDDTVRGWRKLYDERGIAGLERFDAGGSSSRLSMVQEEALKAYVAEALPRTTRQVGAYIEREFGIVYESRAGLIALLHRLGLEYHKPEVIGRKLDTEKQQAFIAAYEKLQNSLGPDEAVLFVDAVHPTHAARPVGCWAPAKRTIWRSSRQAGVSASTFTARSTSRPGKQRMIEAETIDAASTIRLLEAIETLYRCWRSSTFFWTMRAIITPSSCRIGWPSLDARIRLHFIPAYCPHLNPIERLWGVDAQACDAQQMLRHYREFAEETLEFPAQESPQTLAEFRDSVTDNFRVIKPKGFSGSGVNRVYFFL